MTNRTQFETELENLKLDLIRMGDLVIANINNGFASFFTLDRDLAERTIKNDNLVNAAEQDIEKECLRIILKEQPVARDLRLITAILKMITDLERIGDHAADISKMFLFMESAKPYSIPTFGPMAEACKNMIRNALQSFVNGDMNLAKAVIAADDDVDEKFEMIKRTVSAAIRKSEIDGDYAIYAMMIAKYLERIGDHAVNIGEWVIYSLTGEHQNKPEL